MRAWKIEKNGDDSHLVLDNETAPVPGADEILVEVRAAGLNRADLLQRKGHYPPPAGFDPRRPGLEYAGTVARAGKRVTRFKKGDFVMGLIGGGAYAEQVVVHEREAIPIPAGYDCAHAAAMPEAFLTAYRGLFLEGGLAPGQWALVRGATSGVGGAALQLITALGARSIATSRARSRLDELTERFNALGFNSAFDVGVEDSDNQVAREVHERTGGAHLVLDFVGAAALKDNLAALRDEGRQVQIGLLSGGRAELDMGQLLMRRLSVVAMTMRSLPLERRIGMAGVFEERLRPLFESGRLKPLLDQQFDFEQANEAQAAMEAGRHMGKLILIRSDY